jgi:TetR/AcrR family transcriptional regulator, regulator of cefoperazone and chloramphenicol sensitivity
MNLKSVTGPEPQTRRTRRAARFWRRRAGSLPRAGFRHATIREICRRAGANIAAVNYHFGDKETLYAEVLRHSQQKAFEKYPPLLGVAADAPPENKLRAFIQSFLLRIFDGSSTAWFGKMMSREMVEPTAALDLLVRSGCSRWPAICSGGIVAEILDCPPDAEARAACVVSVSSASAFFIIIAGP